MEGLEAFVLHRVREYCRGKNEASLHHLAFHAAPFLDSGDVIQRPKGNLVNH